MNRQELQDWIKSCKRVDIAESEYNEDNHFQTNIYEKDGQLYKIDFCNGEASAKWGKSGYESERDANGKRIKDACGRLSYIYEPIPVKAYPQITVSKQILYITDEENIPLPIITQGIKGDDMSKEDKDFVIDVLRN